MILKRPPFPSSRPPQVNVFSPAQLGALIPYLVVNRGCVPYLSLLPLFLPFPFPSSLYPPSILLLPPPDPTRKKHTKKRPLSVLVHPNTSDEHWDHSTGGFWIGEKFPLDIDLRKLDFSFLSFFSCALRSSLLAFPFLSFPSPRRASSPD